MNKVEINLNRRAYRWEKDKSDGEKLITRSLAFSQETVDLLESAGVLSYRGGGKHGIFAEKAMRAALVLMGCSNDFDDLTALIRRDRDMAKSKIALAENLEELAKRLRNFE